MTDEVESLKAEVERLREENARLEAYIDETCPPRKSHFRSTIMDALSGNAEAVRITFAGTTVTSDVPRFPIESEAGDMCFVEVNAESAGSGTVKIDFFEPSVESTATANHAVLYEDRELTLAEKLRKLFCWVMRRPFSEPRLVAVMEPRQSGDVTACDLKDPAALEPGKSYAIEFPADGSSALN